MKHVKAYEMLSTNISLSSLQFPHLERTIQLVDCLAPKIAMNMLDPLETKKAKPVSNSSRLLLDVDAEFYDNACAKL